MKLLTMLAAVVAAVLIATASIGEAASVPVPRIERTEGKVTR